MSKVDEKQLLLYAQMANLVNVILQWPDISIKEIAENFAKVFTENLGHSHYRLCIGFFEAPVVK